MIFSVILTSLRSLIHVFDLHKRDFFNLPDGKNFSREKKNVAARNQDRSSAAGLQHFCSSKKRLPSSKK